MKKIPLPDYNNTNPCHNCPNRHISCHSTCEQYKSWRIEYDKLSKKSKENEYRDYNYFYHK